MWVAISKWLRSLCGWVVRFHGRVGGCVDTLSGSGSSGGCSPILE